MNNIGTRKKNINKNIKHAEKINLNYLLYYYIFNI